jgi:intraflagellar transport protein 81
LEHHKKRAYLAKYLVPLDVPEEYAGDPEIKKLNEQYRELQAEFQVSHENFETVNKGSLVRCIIDVELGRSEKGYSAT